MSEVVSTATWPAFPGAKPYYFPTDQLARPQTPCAFQVLCEALTTSQVTEINFSGCGLGSSAMEILSDYVRGAIAAIEKVNVSGCTVTPEAAAQLLTAANEASRARLRAHQVLAFSEALHARLGSECLLQAVALDTDVWRRVAQNVRERHGHELMCSQLAQAGQTWFEVTVEVRGAWAF